MLNKEYTVWLKKLKSKIRSTQLKAAVAVNTELIMFYWDFGRLITQKQTSWGTKFIEQLSINLKEEFVDIQGFSFRNLKYIRQFYENAIGQQLFAQIFYRHNLLIIKSR